MNNTLFKKAQDMLSTIKLKNKLIHEERTKEIYSKIQRIAEIDKEISNLGISLTRSMLAKKNSDEALEEFKKGASKLNMEKCELLVANGCKPDYLDEVFSCSMCHDEGYVDGKLCSCLENLYKELVYKAANLPILMDEQSFDTFNLDYYEDNDDEFSPRKTMEIIFNFCKNYALTFADDSKNLLMYGGTGLGKTMLSSCIAKEVIDKGFKVYYQPAYRIFSLFESNKFSNEQDEAIKAQIKYIFNSDLLIIDDLGSELVTTYTAEVLFDLINTRINSGKKTIINTNLSLEDLETIYSPRISSRLTGNYTHLEFTGDDIRKM